MHFIGRDESALCLRREEILTSERFNDKREVFIEIFDVLVKKFRLLKKTKEEKTKFCMRKAFRFLFSMLKKSSSGNMNLKEANEICMRHYFSDRINDVHFVLPFR